MYQTMEVTSEFIKNYPMTAPFEGGESCGLSAHGGARFHDAPDKIKVLLYSHDTFGLGHLRRNLAIIDGLLRYPERFSVLLITGSPVIRQWKLPVGLRVQPLPPVVKTGAERYVSREPAQLFGLVKGYREALILKTVLRFRPDVFLVDHAPAGMNGELLSTLALIRREFPAMRTVLGLRDILDTPAIVRAVWQEQEIHALLEHAYDDVFVYGSEVLVDVAKDYGLTGRLANRVRYCGYVVAAAESPDRCGRQQSRKVCWNDRDAGERPVILVTAGGGGDGFFLIEAFLHAQRVTPGFYSVIVTGPLMPEDQKAALRALAAGRVDV